jgi:hypothetical protein
MKSVAPRTVKMTITTTEDCRGKNTKGNNGIYPTENTQENTEKVTTKNKTNPTPVFEEVLTRLDSQNCGRTT